VTVVVIEVLAKGVKVPEQLAQVAAHFSENIIQPLVHLGVDYGIYRLLPHWINSHPQLILALHRFLQRLD